MRLRILGAGVVIGAALSTVLGVGPASADVTSLLLTPNTVAPGGTVSFSAVINDAGATGGRAVTLSVPPGTDATFAVPSPQPSWADGPCQLNPDPQTVRCVWTPTGPGQSIQLVADLTVGASASAGLIPVTATSPGSDQTAPLLVTLTPTQTADPTPTPTDGATPTPTASSTDGATDGNTTGTGAADTGNPAVPTAVPAGEVPASGVGSGPWALALVVLAAVGGAAAFGAVRRKGQHMA